MHLPSAPTPLDDDWSKLQLRHLLELAEHYKWHEIFINGVNQIIIKTEARSYIEGSPFRSLDQLQLFIQFLAAANDQILNHLNPYGGGFIQDGKYRWHAIDRFACHPGPILTIRKSLNPQMLNLLKSSLQKNSTTFTPLLEAPTPLLITGVTGSGKTTFLRALMETFCPQQRAIWLEDIPEIPITSIYWIRLKSPATKHDVIASKMGPNHHDEKNRYETMLDQCLRLNPDRLILAEIRGAAVSSLFEATKMSSTAPVATMHANSPEALRARIEYLTKAICPPFNQIHIERLKAGSRSVSYVQHAPTSFKRSSPICLQD
jgi:pilus assembly protein CpaF